MQMTKELEKRLKLMQRFNQVRGDKRTMYIKKKPVMIRFLCITA